MKNTLLLVLLLAFSLPLFSQQKAPASYSRHNDFMVKSRRKQRAGIILLSAGGAVTLGSTILIIEGIHHNSHNYYDSELSTGDVEIVFGVLGGLIGIASMSASIPFFVGAHRSRMKALGMSLKTERAPVFAKAGSYLQYPALAFRIPLGR